MLTYRVLAVLFVVNVLTIGRISVFHLQAIRDRQVRGETGIPWLAFPPGFTSSWDVWEKSNYSPEGQRLIPLLIVEFVLWVVAIFITVFSSK